MCPVQFTSTVNCKMCIASSTFPLCRFHPFVRTYYHLLINHLRLLGIKVQEKITFSVTTIEMVTPTGKYYSVFKDDSIVIINPFAPKPWFFAKKGQIVWDEIH